MPRSLGDTLEVRQKPWNHEGDCPEQNSLPPSSARAGRAESAPSIPCCHVFITSLINEHFSLLINQSHAYGCCQHPQQAELLGEIQAVGSFLGHLQQYWALPLHPQYINTITSKKDVSIGSGPEMLWREAVRFP